MENKKKSTQVSNKLKESSRFISNGKGIKVILPKKGK